MLCTVESSYSSTYCNNSEIIVGSVLSLTGLTYRKLTSLKVLHHRKWPLQVILKSFELEDMKFSSEASITVKESKVIYTYLPYMASN